LPGDPAYVPTDVGSGNANAGIGVDAQSLYPACDVIPLRRSQRCRARRREVAYGASKLRV